MQISGSAVSICWACAAVKSVGLGLLTSVICRKSSPHAKLLVWSLADLIAYNINAICPHCEASTFLEAMTENQYALRKPNLTAILHTIICEHCSKRFGNHRGRLVPERQG